MGGGYTPRLTSGYLVIRLRAMPLRGRPAVRFRDGTSRLAGAHAAPARVIGARDASRSTGYTLRRRELPGAPGGLLSRPHIDCSQYPRITREHERVSNCGQWCTGE